MQKKITLPYERELFSTLKVGEDVLLSGVIYSARDQAHKLMVDLINNKAELPMQLFGQTIYYMGPCFLKKNSVISSAGPTTASRMDAFTPKMLDAGIKGMIGKGRRSQEVKKSIIKNKAVYFGAPGGAGVLLAKSIKKCELVAWEELGSEALLKLEIEDMPVVVIIDSIGNDLYELGPKVYRQSSKKFLDI